MFGPSRRELTRMLDRERAAWAHERSVLLDRIMYLSGRSWGLPDHEIEEQLNEPTPLAESALQFLPGGPGEHDAE